MVDWIPVLSQAKSALQAILGDIKGAIITQDNFSRQCPVVSQGRSLFELIFVNKQTALQTQIEFLYFILSLFDSIPLIGHVKGVLHHALGDKDGGGNAMKSASRRLVVMAGGAIGFAIGGNLGAVIGGIVSGQAVDLDITDIDFDGHGEKNPFGLVRQNEELTENPSDPGKWFDIIAMVAGDGAWGYVGGRAYVLVKEDLAREGIRKQFKNYDLPIRKKHTPKTMENFSNPNFIIPYSKASMKPTTDRDYYKYYKGNSHSFSELALPSGAPNEKMNKIRAIKQ